MPRLAAATLGFVVIFCGSTWVSARDLDIRDFGARAAKDPPSHAHVLVNNSQSITSALAAALPGDRVIVPALASETFWCTGGIHASGLHNVTLEIQGLVKASGGWDHWPQHGSGSHRNDFAPLIAISNSSFVVLKGSGEIDGSGKVWWDRYVLKPLKGERPKMVELTNVTDLVVQDLTLRNSPSWTLNIVDAARAEIHHVTVDIDRKMPVFDPKLQPEDLNTDGFDLAGKDIWVHDCTIRNDDDSIAVKPCGPGRCVNARCTENLLIENSKFIGFGASIGSVPPEVPPAGEKYGHCVRNVTFRNISMPGTGKGIYVKSNPSCAADGSKTALIADILYEDIHIEKPLMWAIWIGPQQQHEPGTALGDKCALTYPLHNHCPTQGCVTFRNITLRRVTVTDPVLSPGVILGNSSNPMTVSFEDVKVVYTSIFRGRLPWGRKFKCLHTDMNAAATNPTPKCAAADVEEGEEDENEVLALV